MGLCYFWIPGTSGCCDGTNYRSPRSQFKVRSPKLCHRCGKLGCNSQSCPLRGGRGRSRTRDPVAKLCDRIKLNQPTNKSNSSRPRSRSKSRDRSRSEASRSGPANPNSDQRNQKSSSHDKQTPQSGLVSRSIKNDFAMIVYMIT